MPMSKEINSSPSGKFIFYHYFLLAFAFFLPFGHKPIAILIIGILLTWLLKGGIKNGFKQLDYPKITILFLSVYAVYLLGCIHSVNFVYGLKDLETKLSLLIFPIALVNADFNKQKFNAVLLSFIIGCSTAIVICFTNAFWNFYVTTNSIFLFYSFLSYFIHVGYFSMYLSLAICIVVYLMSENGFVNNLRNRLLVAALLLISITQVFLSSKTGILLLCLFSLIAVVYLLKNSRVMAISAIIVLFLVVFFGFNKMEFMKSRFQMMKVSMMDKNIDHNTTEGTAVRILVWESAIELIKEHPFIGYGTGDVKDALLKKYAEKKLVVATLFQLNAHNQFLQTAVTLGIFGLLVLLCSMLIPFGIAIYLKNYLYPLFILIVFFNCLTESILETQAGVVFFGFFNSLLFYNMKRNRPN
jgi:O-antigen ligase